MALFSVHKGDITQQETDAIVNAANSSLLGGGGVDGAIHRAAGPELLEACRKLNGCKTGQAKITPGFRLKARYIIHTVGPVWDGGKNNEAQLLTDAYHNSLELAMKYNVATIAFPNIGTGVYRFPRNEAAEIALATVAQFCRQHPEALKEIVFVCYDDENYRLYRSLLD